MSSLAVEHDAINLGQGFPNYACDPLLIECIEKALKSGKNQYAPMMGVQPLRESLRDKLNQSYDCQLNISNICITAGATQAIFTAILSQICPGDEVIIFEPAYDSYIPSVQQAGGVPILINVKAPYNAVPWGKVSQAISPKTKLIITNTPHNPTGYVWSKHDYQSLEEIVAQTDIVVLSDEVYEHLVYDGLKHRSILDYPTLRDNSMAVFSFGKSLHVTGWKLGYIVAPQSLMEKFTNLHQWNVFSVNSFIQYGISEYIQDKSRFERIASFLQKKRDLLIDGMTSLHFNMLPCLGTYFALWDYSSISTLNDIDFSKHLVKEYGIATIPISPFQSDPLESQIVRLCFAKEDDTINRALSKLGRIEHES